MPLIPWQPKLREHRQAHGPDHRLWLDHYPYEDVVFRCQFCDYTLRITLQTAPGGDPPWEKKESYTAFCRDIETQLDWLHAEPIESIVPTAYQHLLDEEGSCPPGR